MNKNLKKYVLVGLGFFSLALGVIGLLLPIMPTVPFLLVSAACFANSSEKHYRWLTTHPHFGHHILHYREGRGISKKVKYLSLIMLWISLNFSAWFFVHLIWLRITMYIILILITIHILSIKNYQS